MDKISLPIDAYVSQIQDLMKTHQNLVITAAPGAGKTTRVPAALSQIMNGQILVLEPRRMAAIAAASRVCEEEGAELGHQVGYQVRFQNKISPKTKIIFLTEALLVKKLAQDPELKNVSVIVLDEFHERSIHVDLAIGLIRELQILGSEIKMVIMSATLDAQSLSNYLDQAPVLEVPGKLFPLQIVYSQKPQLLNLQEPFFKSLESLIFEASSKCRQDILVFLPGQGEIERCFQRLLPWCEQKGFLLQKLHGNLSLEEQNKALKKADRRRIILSTNIAESSVTLDGVDAVIDSGLEKVLRYSSGSQFSRLDLARISLSSATQRAGRAARQKEGICFKMWTKLDEASMSPFMTPEILRIDLTESLLMLAQQGVQRFEEFSWFEVPPQKSIEVATEKLKITEAITSSGHITELGTVLLKMPLPVELGLLILAAQTNEEKVLACQIASLLQEKDILRKESQLRSESLEQSDLLVRLEYLNLSMQKKYPANCSRRTLDLVIQSFQQLSSLLGTPAQILQQIDETILEHLLLKAFRMRLGRRRKSDLTKGVLTNGKGVVFSAQSLCHSAEFFVALSGVDLAGSSDTLISIAHPIEKSKILQFFKNVIVSESEISFDKEKAELYKRSIKKLDQLLIEEGPQHKADSQEIAAALPQIILGRWTELTSQNKSFGKTLEQLVFLESRKNLFPMGLQGLLTEFQVTNSKLLKKFSELAAQGQNSFQNVCQADLRYLFLSLLPEDIQTLLQKLPFHLKVPSGSEIPVHYEPGKDPYLEVRIQELFGWKQSPRIMDLFPLVIHLLGPNYKPMQVTADLNSFWSNTYSEVRKELRLKYPKHQWPEDPSQGIAEAKGRRRF